MTERLLTPSQALKRLPSSERLEAVRRRWEESGEPDALSVLNEQPELLADKSFVLDLAFEECAQRYTRGEQVDVEAYCARFPKYRSSLQRMLAALQLVEENPEAVEQALLYRWPNPGERLGDLTLLQELGRGRFARAYLAREASTGNRLVVAKFTLDGAHEAHTLGRLNHPHIVPVLAAGHDPNTNLHLVRMPYLGQATLEDLIEHAFPAPDSRPTTAALILEVAQTEITVEDSTPDVLLHQGSYEEGILRLLEQIAGALAFLHDKGVCHRDLKPTNVLLNPAGRAFLLDFNLSTENSLARGRLGGTLPYMAPEQLRAMMARQGESPGPAADVFALGVIARELLTGRHPFGPVPASGTIETLAALLLERQGAGARPLRAVNPRVPASLACLLDRCLDSDPAQRPKAALLAAETRRCLQVFQRRRTWRARWLRVALAAGVLGLMLAGGVVALRPTDTPASATPPPADQDPVAVLFAQGRRHLDADQRPQAQNCFLELLRLNPQDGRAMACLAYLKALDKSHLEAKEWADKAIAAGFQTPQVYNNRGYCLVHMYDRALRNRDPRASAWYDQAHADLTEALRLSNQQLQAGFYNRATLIFRGKMSDFSRPLDQAVEDIRQAVALGPVTSQLCSDAARIVAKAAKDRQELTDEVLNYLELGIKNGLDPRLLVRNPYFKDWDRHPRFIELLQMNPGPPVIGELRLVSPVSDNK